MIKGIGTSNGIGIGRALLIENNIFILIFQKVIKVPNMMNPSAEKEV